MRFWVVLGFCLSAMLHAANVYAALSPNISTAQIRNFTRLTFNWPEQVRFRVQPFDGGVTLTFNKPTAIQTGAISSSLQGVVSSVRRSDDGTRITLNFAKPYRVRHFISGNANGIDILGTQTAKKPEPKIETPPAKPKADLQTQPIAPEAAEEPAAQPTANISEAAPEAEAETETAAEENKTASASSAAAQAEQPAQTAASEEEEKPETAAQDVPALAQETPEPEVAKTAETPQAQAAPQSATQEAAAAPAVAAQAPQETAPSQGTNPQQSMPLSPVSPNGAIDTNAAQLEPEPAPETIKQAPQTQQAQASVDDNFLITTYSRPTGTEIRFPWLQRSAAAAFMREDVLWIVFSKQKQINMARLKSILPASILAADQIPLEGHTVLRLQTDGTVFPKVTQPKNSAQWWVTLSIYRQMPARPIAIERKVKGTRKPHLYIPVLQYSKPATLTDPLIGDEIVIVPYYSPGEGVYPARRFAELDVLNSAQGIAAVKKDDYVQARQLRNGVRLTSRDGLSLSESLPELALAELESLSEAGTWYPYENWRVEPGQFFDARRRIEEQLRNSADVRANSLRLKLVQLYLGEGLAQEALAWLDIIQDKDPFFFKDRKLAALRGAAYFLRDDYVAAKRSFMDNTLADYDERKLWLEALAIFEKDRPRFDYMDYFQPYISKYPPAMREKLGIIATDNYINRKSFTRAIKTLDTLSLTGMQPQVMPYVNFLMGKIAAENGNLKGARELWDPLIEADANRFVRTTAQFALTTMLYNQGEIDRKEAIKRLDRLRVVWRGDALELALLDYLGGLYADDEQHLEALRVWQDIVQNFPDSQMALDSARKMADTFNMLYAQGGADKMSPLKALATFYEFRQLTPIGQAGDVMIQALADRLIGVDLLPRAAALLEHQIRFRQEKLARSQLGTKLALVYILDENPERALQILELTGFGQMPKALQQQRTRLAALAMLRNNEPNRALDMLASDISREADNLRLQLYWQMRNWPDAIVTAEQLLGSRSDVTAPLNDAETQQLLQLSIAYMFERNRNQLDYLRQYFQPLMPDGPNKDIFMFVTDPGAPLDPQAFDRVAGQIAQMESFMNNYRKQVEDGGLASMVN